MSQKVLFHAGELAVQLRAGESQMARMNAGALSDRIPGGAIPFLAQQPMAVAASTAADGAVWASVLVGEPGFISAADAHTVKIDISMPPAAMDDPLWANLQHDNTVGLLVIELGSRRRLRINGKTSLEDGRQLKVDVGVAYPNCPKYIQRRHWSWPAASSQRAASGRGRQGRTLDDRQRNWIAAADTLFVASAHPGQGADASHRGGRPGFVQIVDDSRLRVPDYSGNSMFNTLGNFESYPHAGLAFLDFEQGRLLQLAGRPVIRWDLDDPQQHTGGTGRFWDFEVELWRESELSFQLQWELIDFSPFNPAPLEGEDQLVLQVVEVHQETDRTKRFRLRASDDAELPAFEPGAHLPVSLPAAADGELFLRHYSILSDPGERAYYDIAVLRESSSRGGSRYLHDTLGSGDPLIALPPKNAFPMHRSARHSILIAGGIGITPILSMLRQHVRDRDSFELHHSAQRWSDLVFRTDIEALAGDRANFYATRESDGSRIPLDDLLAAPEADTHVYVCGPRRLIVAVRDSARANGWNDEQIHFESFGAARLSDDHAITVELVRSGKSINVPADRTILESLLVAGVDVPHECKRGECGLCATAFVEGEPDHRDLCLTPVERQQLLCVCVSRSKSDTLVLDG
jgi:hypothetical protein